MSEVVLVRPWIDQVEVRFFRMREGDLETIDRNCGSGSSD